MSRLASAKNRIAMGVGRLAEGAGPASWRDVVLFLWFLSFSIGPRIELLGLPGDFRIQELVILPALLAVYFFRDFLSVIRRGGSATVAGVLLWALVLVFIIVAAITIYSGSPNQEIFIRLGFLLRYFETFATLILVVRLLEAKPQRGLIVALFSLAVGLAANLIWMSIQLIGGFRAPAYAFSNTAPAMYGPGLIGEGGVFGTGQYLTILGALLLAALFVGFSRKMRVPLLAVLGLVFFFQLEVNSRASILSTAVLTVLLATAAFTLVLGIRRQIQFFVLAGMTVVAGVTLVTFLVPRLGPRPVISALQQRFIDWHAPVFEALARQPWTGLGPGGSRIAASGETHSVYVMLFGDFGLLGLAIFFSLTILVLLSATQVTLTTASNATRLLGLSAVLVILNVLIVGIAQDALLPVNTTHLLFAVLGLYFGAGANHHLQYLVGQQERRPHVSAKKMGWCR